jgi:membrane protein required for colicin V production
MKIEQWTFFDCICLLIILVSTGFALTKGLAREVISLAALLGGFFLAVLYYPVISSHLSEFTRTEAVSDLLGFVFIFLGTLIVGAVAAFLVNRFVKMASLQWVDRLLGGLYGFIRGWAVASVLVVALIAFPVRPDTIARSSLAPYLLAGAKAAVLVVPQKLKDKFNEEYKKVLQAWNQNRNPA